MPLNHIPELSAWLREAGVEELEFIGPSTRLRLILENDGGETAEIVRAAEAPDEITTAPMFGIFLHRHPMSSVPLVAEGSPVSAGQVVGLLRIGPLLIPVTAPRDGIVTTMLAPHEATVGYGSELIAFHSRES